MNFFQVNLEPPDPGIYFGTAICFEIFTQPEEELLMLTDNKLTKRTFYDIDGNEIDPDRICIKHTPGFIAYELDISSCIVKSFSNTSLTMKRVAEYTLKDRTNLLFDNENKLCGELPFNFNSEWYQHDSCFEVRVAKMREHVMKMITDISAETPINTVCEIISCNAFAPRTLLIDLDNYKQNYVTIYSKFPRNRDVVLYQSVFNDTDLDICNKIPLDVCKKMQTLDGYLKIKYYMVK
jgi:hypothetical protein